MIEAEFDIKPCTAYKFDLKIVSPRNAEMGSIKGLQLPALSEMYDFHPPHLTEILDIDARTGSIKIKPNSGIPSTCTQDFFEAVDNHMSYLEEDLLFHMNQEFQAHQNTQSWVNKLDNHKRQQLLSDGCSCNSTWISINGTLVSSYKNYMGNYHFEGMFKVSLINNNQKIQIDMTRYSIFSGPSLL